MDKADFAKFSKLMETILSMYNRHWSEEAISMAFVNLQDLSLKQVNDGLQRHVRGVSLCSHRGGHPRGHLWHRRRQVPGGLDGGPEDHAKTWLYGVGPVLGASCTLCHRGARWLVVLLPKLRLPAGAEVSAVLPVWAQASCPPGRTLGGISPEKRKSETLVGPIVCLW